MLRSRFFFSRNYSRRFLWQIQLVASFRFLFSFEYAASMPTRPYPHSWAPPPSPPLARADAPRYSRGRRRLISPVCIFAFDVGPEGEIGGGGLKRQWGKREEGRLFGFWRQIEGGGKIFLPLPIRPFLSPPPPPPPPSCALPSFYFSLLLLLLRRRRRRRRLLLFPLSPPVGDRRRQMYEMFGRQVRNSSATFHGTPTRLNARCGMQNSV